MTKDEAIAWLRRYRKEETYIPSRRLYGWRKNYEFNHAVYERYLVLELIRRIRASAMPPLEVVRRFYYAMDDVLCESEDGHAITHTFASMMENCASDILHYLRAKDKEGERDEQN